jgi:hypothetical protein
MKVVEEEGKEIENVLNEKSFEDDPDHALDVPFWCA